VSPIIGGAAVSGPAAELMRSEGLEASIAGVAQAYSDFLDVLVVDDRDSALARSLSSPRLQVHSTNILMSSQEDRVRIARLALRLACPEIVAEPAVEAQ
jgi:LPPG:FO 2-phospho-L-lactate transferase